MKISDMTPEFEAGFFKGLAEAITTSMPQCSCGTGTPHPCNFVAIVLDEGENRLVTNMTLSSSSQIAILLRDIAGKLDAADFSKVDLNADLHDPTRN